MTGIAQCKKCKILYRFPIIDRNVPPCPKCNGKGITDDGGFLVNGLNPDDMYGVHPIKDKK